MGLFLSVRGTMRYLGKFGFGSWRLGLLNGVDPGGESLRRGEIVSSLVTTSYAWLELFDIYFFIYISLSNGFVFVSRICQNWFLFNLRVQKKHTAISWPDGEVSRRRTNLS